MDFKCLKCGKDEFELKSMIIPEKSEDKPKFDFGHYYIKVCLNCGFCEMYSAKVLEENEKTNLAY